MAVEIPVVIDIDKAFEEAANRVGSAMRPLKQSIDDKGVLELKFRTTIPKDDLRKFSKEIQATAKETDEGMISIERSFEQLWESGKPKLDDVRASLVSFKQSLNSKWNSPSFDPNSDEVKSLQKAIILSEEYLNNRNRAVSLTEEQYYAELRAAREAEKRNFIIQQEAATISQITARLSALRGNLDNLNPKTKEWRDTALEINRTTAELEKYQNKLALLGTKSGSIDRMSIQMQQLTKTWNAMSREQKFDKDGNIKASAQKVIDKYKQLTIEAEKYGKSLQEYARGANVELEQTNSRLATLIKNSIRLFALHTASQFIRSVREVTAEFELQRVALGSIIQDTERAEGLFRQIKAAAIESPFEIKDLVSYTKQLSAYRIETDKLFDVTMRLADISAGLGVDMSRLVLAYGQVRAASVLRGQELRQFTEAGIPLVDELAKKFTKLRGETVKTGEVFQLISERAVPFRMIEEIFEDMTSAGGIFYKMQEKQAKTLAGQWANLKDAVSIMYDEIGNTDTVHNAMETLIKDARNIFKNWRTIADVIKIVGNSVLAYISISKLATLQIKLQEYAEAKLTVVESEREKGMKRMITTIIGETAAEKVSTAAKQAHLFATNKLAAANTVLGKTFWALTAAMLSNPFGAIAVAAGALVGLFSILSRKARDVNKDIDAANASIASLNKSRTETQRLIDSYEELSKKQSLTVDESKKLKDISSELAAIFPKASEGIDKNTNSLALNIEKLKEYNKQTQEATKVGLQAQIKTDEREMRKNQRQIDKLSRDLIRGYGTNKYNRTARILSPIALPFSAKQKAEMNEELTELIKKNEQYAASIKEMQDAIDGLDKKTGDAEESMTLWQKKLVEFNSRIDESGKVIQVLSPDQIEGYSKLDDALEDLAKKYKEQSEQVKVLEKAKEGKNAEEAAELALSLRLAKARKNLTKEILDYYNAFYLTKKNNKGGGYQKDAFITLMENRIKFMKDFKKGYDDLNKYLSEEGALSEQSRIMLGRGMSLGMSAAEQARAAKELSDWYTDQVNKVVKEMQSKGLAGKTVTEMLSHQITGESNRSKMLRDYQALLQSLWDAKTDFDTTQAEKNIEDAIKKISDDIKRSEVARDFYKNILDLTGDEDLAENLTVSVYGGVGKDFKDRIQEQLYRALNEIDPSGINKDLMSTLLGDIAIFDIKDIQENIEKLPPKVKEMFEKILEENQKYDAEWFVDFEKTYAKAMTYQERVDRLNAQRLQKEKEAASMGKSPEEIARITEYYNREIAKVQLEAKKDTYTWTKAFEDLDGVSSRTLKNLIKLIDDYVDIYGKDLEPQQLKELARQRESAKQQLNSRNAYKAAGDAIKDLVSARRRANNLQKDGKEGSEEHTRALDDESDAVKRLGEAFSEIESELGSVIASTKDLMSVFASDEDASFFGGQLDNLSKTIGGIGKASVGIAQLATGQITPQAIIQTITGLSDIVSGIFGGIKASQIRDINKQIEHQQDLLDDLSYSYDRLEKAMAKAFGSDYIYNYNKQLENLNAQVEAYRAQADLEASKGKKADADKIKEYENNARDAQDQITEMQSQLSEFFAGTDLTSAAKDFANSWIEAYKEFGSTTDAMKEKFQDMIQNMIVNSLAARIVEEQLGPIFDMIDRLSKDDGILSAKDIADVAAETDKIIPNLNNALTGFMNSLTSLGYNIRQGVGGFTGISRDIAGASEESITGLAAGINTQNFYMSLISQNVAAILAAMTGETVEGATGAAVPDPYKEQVLTYMGSLPQMRDDMYAIRTLLERVIKPNGTSATHYVATRM